MHQQVRPTWAEINLDNVVHNVQAIKQHLATGCEIISVVKADAYGHGATQIAQAALKAGATRLAVSILDEASELRQAGITAPILVLGYTPSEQGGLAARLCVSLAVYERQNAWGLVQAAEAIGEILPVHLKVDTGMGRLGVLPDEVVAFASFLQGLPGCALEGVFSHLAKADEDDIRPTLLQLQRFELALARLQQAGIAIPLVHIANSAAAMRFPASHFSAVRLGLAMYGFYPHPTLKDQGFDLRPVMSLKTKVAHTKWLPAGSPISYGGRYITRQPSFIVTLPFGYADGFQRSLSGKAAVLLRGHKIPLVGTICMDQCMADATSVPEARVGDEVVIWGQDQGLSIAADDVARSAGTIVNEVTALVSKRVPRLYSYQGRTVAVRTLLPPTDIIGSLVSDRLKQS